VTKPEQEFMAEDDIDPLITECPKCQTRFRVTESQLQVAAGRVRCGACLAVFQGVEHLNWDDEPQFESSHEAQSALDELLDELNEDNSSPPRSETSETSETIDLNELEIGSLEVVPAEQQVADEDSPDQGPVDEEKLDEEELKEEPVVEGPIEFLVSEGAPLESDDPDPAWSEPAHQIYGGYEDLAEVGSEVPAQHDIEVEELVIDQVADHGGVSFDDEIAADPVVAEPLAREPFTFGPEPTKHRWWVTLATLVAVLALIAQVMWYQFETWSRDLDIRPFYALVCEQMGCKLPVMIDIERMLASNLVVRSHPEVANALLVDAIIVNRADFVQPFPVLELRFTSLQGNLVAGRRFQPAEYLAGELKGVTLIEPQVPIHVELAIEDPGESAVNYFLTFR
jgi:predicted Zn finger-like uncharacterized protein